MGDFPFLYKCHTSVADLGLNFWVGTNDVGGLISGCGQLSLHESQNFEDLASSFVVNKLFT